MADELDNLDQIENDPVMEKFIRDRVMLTPEQRAQQKMQEYLRSTYGLTGTSGKGRKIYAGVGEALKALSPKYKNPMDRYSAEALNEYKAEVPTLQRESAVMSANRRASLAEQNKADIAAQANKLKEKLDASKMSLEQLKIAAQSTNTDKRNAALERIAEINAQGKLDVEKERTNAMAALRESQVGLNNAGANLKKLETGDLPNQQNAVLNQLDLSLARGKFFKGGGGHGGSTSTSTSTSPLQYNKTDPGTGAQVHVVDPNTPISRTTTRTSSGSGGAGVPPMSPQQIRETLSGGKPLSSIPATQPQGQPPIQNPAMLSKPMGPTLAQGGLAPQTINPQQALIDAQKNIPQGEVKEIPLGITTQKERENYNNETKFANSLQNIQDIFSSEYTKDKKGLSWAGLAGNAFGLGGPIRGIFNKKSVSESLYDTLSKSNLAEFVRTFSGLQTSNQEREFLASILPKKGNGIETTLQDALISNFLFQIAIHRKRNNIDSERTSLVNPLGQTKRKDDEGKDRVILGTVSSDLQKHIQDLVNRMKLARQGLGKPPSKEEMDPITWFENWRKSKTAGLEHLNQPVPQRTVPKGARVRYDSKTGQLVEIKE